MMFMVTLSLSQNATWAYAVSIAGRGIDAHECGSGYGTPEEALREGLASINYSSAQLTPKGNC